MKDTYMYSVISTTTHLHYLPIYPPNIAPIPRTPPTIPPHNCSFPLKAPNELGARTQNVPNCLFRQALGNEICTYVPKIVVPRYSTA